MRIILEDEEELWKMRSRRRDYLKTFYKEAKTYIKSNFLPS
jgi:hypothetical protein